MNLCVTKNPDTIWYRGNNLTAVGYSITAWLVQAVKYEYRDYFTKKRAFEDNPFWEYPVPKWVRDKWDSWDYLLLFYCSPGTGGTIRIHRPIILQLAGRGC